MLFLDFQDLAMGFDIISHLILPNYDGTKNAEFSSESKQSHEANLQGSIKMLLFHSVLILGFPQDSSQSTEVF